jgi:ATP-binding cassette subfamily B protein
MPDFEQKKKSLPLRTIFSWYWRVVGEYRGWFIAAFLIYGLGILFADVFTVIAYKHIIDIVAGADGAAKSEVWKWFSILAGFHLVHFILFRLGDICFAISQNRSIRDLSRFVFSEIQKHSYDFFSNRFSGSLTSQARRFIDAFTTLHDGIVFTLWLNGVQLIGMFVVIAFFSPVLAIFFLLAVVAIVVAVLPLLKKRRVFDEREAEENSKLIGRFSDVVTNILNVKMFASGERERSEFETVADREARARMRSWKVFITLSTVQNGLIIILQVAAFFFALFLWTQGKITPGTVVLVQTYLLSIFGIVWGLTHSASRLLKAIASASEMIEIFELSPDIVDVERPETCRIKNGNIEFRDIAFTYEGGDRVFEEFSFSVRSGEKVGLVGPSGGGKSTITKLLLRFVDPQKGGIFVDGQDIRNIRQDDLRSNISYVPQDPVLFHRSLYENIAYGRSDASAEEVYDAAKRAHAHEFIERLEKGYETLVGERGIKLSGGQRQRIAIARAILKGAPILVLDEATSALDSESEHAIQLAFDELMKGRTVIIIAHRLSTIRKMDRIVVLGENGKIAEEGTHDELLSREGSYAKLWKRQTGSFIA